MTRRTRVEKSENAKFKYQFHEVSRSISLAALTASGGADYWKFMVFPERFNKEVFQRFAKEGIDFAFPTQTLYLARDITRPLNFGILREGEKGGIS